MIDCPTLKPPSESSMSEQETARAKPPRGSFWSHYSTIINFWLDVALLILFMVQAQIIAILNVVFPRGAGPEWTVWGGTPTDWSDALFITFCVFSVGIVVHVMFHWAWICGVVATRILRRRAGKDDGSHTLIGVGVIVLLIHVLMAGLLFAKVSLTTSQ